MKIETLLLTLLLISNISFAQFILRGKITDAKTNLPIESASISRNIESNAKAFTNDKGEFEITSQQEKDSISITSIGYEKCFFEVKNNIISKISLQPSVVSLKDITINSKNFGKLNTISKIDLQLKPVNNSQELLRIVPGLFIAQHAGGGKAEQIFLRGFDADHGTDINITVDGMPVNMVSHAHGQGYADAHFIIPETVNTIDFGTGPYYANQGNLNTAGYVAFSTYKTISKSSIQTEYGNFNNTRTVALIDVFKKNKSNTNAYVAGEFYHFDGPTINPQKLNRYNLFTKFNSNLSNKTSLTISASAFKSNWFASGQLPTRAVKRGMIDRFGSLDPSEGGITERYNFNAISTHYFKNQTKLVNQFYFTKYNFSLFSNFTFFLRDSINGDEINQTENRNIYGFTSTLNTKKYINNKHTINSEYAVGFRFDDIRDNGLSNVVKRIFLSYINFGNIKELNTFFYTNHQINFNKLAITIGARIDHFNFIYADKLVKNPLQQNQAKSIVSPKLNIQYNISNSLQSYIKFGKGFHSNDARVVIANNGKEILPAAYGVDFGINMKPASNFYVNLAFWYLKLEQEFVYVGDEGILEPSGQTVRKGIDIITRYQINKNIFFNNNINFSQSRFVNEPKGENYIPLAPSFTATGGLFYKKLEGLSASLNYRTIANRAANENNSITAKGYFLADATISYTKKNLEFSFSMDNIFNAKWNEAQFATTSRLQQEPMAVNELHFTPGNPRAVKFKIVYSF